MYTTATPQRCPYGQLASRSDGARARANEEILFFLDVAEQRALSAFALYLVFDMWPQKKQEQRDKPEAYARAEAANVVACSTVVVESALSGATYGLAFGVAEALFVGGGIISVPLCAAEVCCRPPR